MAHEYHVNVDEGGRTQTYSVHVDDHQHHANWTDIALFFGLLASLMSVSKDAIKAARWIQRK